MKEERRRPDFGAVLLVEPCTKPIRKHRSSLQRIAGRIVNKIKRRKEGEERGDWDGRKRWKGSSSCTALFEDKRIVSESQKRHRWSVCHMREIEIIERQKTVTTRGGKRVVCEGTDAREGSELSH